ncbi:MAG: hypothetical protein ACFFKA_17820 [Candidatus Thorarchaeota archaeon]
MEEVIIFKTELECDKHKAFEIFTINEYLENWLTEKADVVPKLGGKYELFWD